MRLDGGRWPAGFSSGRHEGLSAAKVLVVDDDRGGAEAVSDLLEDQGYEVDYAANGQEALEHLRDESALPGVILLDLWMPVMNGWTFREAQRQDPKLAEIPVVVITATTPPEDDPMRELPILSKPVDVESLLELVARHCGRPRDS